MNVQRDGGAFCYDADGEINRDDIEDVFEKITDPSNLTLNMVEGSNLLVVDNAMINLSDSDFSNIISVIPALNSKIHGTGYNEVKFINSKFLIDEDINLDDDNNRYYKTLPKIKPVAVGLDNGRNLTGTKDGQVGIKANYVADSLGTIKLTGKNTVALFSKEAAGNLGFIEVGEDSIAQYIVNDDVDNMGYNLNSGNIKLGKTSTGIRMDREYNNIGGEANNESSGKISSTAEKVTKVLS